MSVNVNERLNFFEWLNDYWYLTKDDYKELSYQKRTDYRKRYEKWLSDHVL